MADLVSLARSISEAVFRAISETVKVTVDLQRPNFANFFFLCS